MDKAPKNRLRIAVDRSPRPDGAYILYWMIANRRPHHNFSLDHAIAWAQELDRPLLVFEPLRCGTRWASDRMHRFALEGMRENAAAFEKQGVAYYPYVEPAHDAGKGLLLALAKKACLVVTDDDPMFFSPKMLHSVQQTMPARLELIDSNGLLPIHTPTQSYPTAYAFRRYLQKELPNHLTVVPRAQPLRGARDLPKGKVPAEILKTWPAATPELLAADAAALGELPIDHAVGPAAFAGGAVAGSACARRFVQDNLDTYIEGRNHPDIGSASGASPYLHYGHLSVHEIFALLVERENWDITELSGSTTGRREGFWGMSPASEAFLDELITWREIGFNMVVQHPETYDKYESLPDWAQRTLSEHQNDERPYTYSLEEFEAARTDDPVWNAAQRQIVRDGRLHNYMRMLWGKQVLHWSKTPQEAVQTLIHLNNKYGVDGSDPNSYSGIFWTFGRFDRPWPERAVFGKIRCMTSASTEKKLKLKKYLATYGKD
jgi:deoxyribodipyrimidine photo-lyase